MPRPRIPHKIIDGVEHKRCNGCSNWLVCTKFHKGKRNWDKLADRCKTCQKLYNKNHYKINKDKILKRNKEYRDQNIEKTSACVMSWRNKNRERVNIYRRQWKRQRRKNNPSWALQEDIRSRLTHLLAGRRKSKSTLQLIDCSEMKLKYHMEKQFSEHMTWENKGMKGWHVDHRVPCNAFDLSNPLHQRVCFWYKNLQPLWAKDNIRKKDKYKEEDKQTLIKEWIFFHI
jgi:hypothetical protein